MQLFFTLKISKNNSMAIIDEKTRIKSFNDTIGLTNSFKEHFIALGCLVENSVNVSSGIDPSVRFIGSHISVLKKYLTEKIIPPRGVIIVQNCVRTRNINYYGDGSFMPKWGSSFVSLGGLFLYVEIEDVGKEVFKFLKKNLMVEERQIYLRVSSQDKDLLQVCVSNPYGFKIEVNGNQENYYRHSIGLNEFVGRNFNFALLNKESGSLEDIGNFIILECKGVYHSIEVALGTSTIIKIRNSLEHILDCYPLLINTSNDLHSLNLKRQLEDCIITASLLLSENLTPSNKDNKTRILKKYISKLKSISVDLNLSKEQLTSSIFDYEKLNYSATKPLFEYLMQQYDKA